MANILEIILKATDQASAVLKQSRDEVTQFSKAYEETGKKSELIGTKLAGDMQKAGLAMTGLGIAAKVMSDDINNSFLAFDKAMTEVEALNVDSVTQSMDQLKQKAFDISSTMPIAATDVANAMYQMISVGYEASEAIESIDPAAQLAVAGSVDLADAMNATINAMSAYESQGMTAAHATEVMAKAVGEGKWELNDFLQELMKNIGIASSLGIEFEQLAAMNVMLQNSFTDASTAGTSLNAMMIEMVKPEKVSMFAELGVAIKDDNGNLRDMKDIFVDLKGALDSAGGSVDKTGKLQELFGTYGYRAADAIMKQVDELDGYTERMGDASFITEQFNTKVESTGAKLEIANNKMTNAKIALGDAMAPATMAAADAMSGLASIISGMPGPLQAVAGGFLTASQSLIIIGPALAGLPTIVNGANTAFNLLSKNGIGGLIKSIPLLGGLASSIGPMLMGMIIPWGALVIAAVALFAVAWKTNFLGIRDTVAGLEDFVKERFEGIKSALSDLGERIAPTVDKLKGSFGKLMDSVDGLFKKFAGGKGVVDVLKSAFELLGRIVDTVAKKFISGLGDAIDLVIRGLTWLVDGVTAVVDWFSRLANNPVVQFFTGLTSAAAETTSGLLDRLVPAVDKTNTGLTDGAAAAEDMAGGLDKTTASADNTGQSTSTLTGLMGALGTTGTGALDGIAGAAGRAEIAIERMQAFVRDATGAWQGLQEIINTGSTYYNWNEKTGQWDQMVPADDGQGFVPFGSNVGKNGGSGGYTPTGGVFTEQQWRDMDANQRASITNNDAIYQVGDQTFYHGYSTDTMEDKYTSWVEGTGYSSGSEGATGGAGGNGSTGGGSSPSGYTPYDPNANAPDGMTWVDDGDGGYYSYAAGGGKVTRGGKLTVAEDGYEIVIMPDGKRMLFTKEQQTELPAGAKILPGSHTGWTSFDELSQSGTGEGAGLESLFPSIDIRKRLTDSIKDETTKRKSAYDAIKEQIRAIVDNTAETFKASGMHKTYTGRLQESDDALDTTSRNLSHWNIKTVGDTEKMTEGALESTGAMNYGVNNDFFSMAEISRSSSAEIMANVQSMFEGIGKMATEQAVVTEQACTGAGCAVQQLSDGWNNLVNVFAQAESSGCTSGACGFSSGGGTGPCGMDRGNTYWDSIGPSWTINTDIQWTPRNWPHLAGGGRITSPGMAMVGEQGPEIVSLSKGASVIPINKAGKGGGEVHVHIGTLVADRAGLMKLWKELSKISIFEDARRGVTT